MRTRTSFLNTRIEEPVSTSFDLREERYSKDIETESKTKRRSKTCNNRSREGIFYGPAYRPPERAFHSPISGREPQNERMNLAIQVRRLHAARTQERTVPKVVVKDITAELARFATQLPYFKKPFPIVTISRIKVRKVVEDKIIKDTKKPLRPVNKVSVKEALRNKEWVLKAKSNIFKMFFEALNKSNAVKASIPEEVNLTYKYYIGPGNNSKLIEKCLNSRWWWVRVDDEDEANFIWTQWKSQEIVDKLEKFKGRVEIESRNRLEVSTNVQLFKEGEKPSNVDLGPLGFARITKAQNFLRMKQISVLSQELRCYNKLEFNFEIANKKNLFFNMTKFYLDRGKDPFDVIPLTFHVNSKDDQSFKDFCKYYEDKIGENESFWIVKPGENSNRGNGIEICSSLHEVKCIVQSTCNKRTHIIQKYIENPFLIKSRKFDIRCFALVTSIHGIVQGYFYTEGYIRTSSKAFTLEKNSKFIHLTNDAVQKQSEEYGKFESSNKLSFSDFERYLQLNYPKKVDFKEQVLSQIRKIVADTIQATSAKLDFNRRMNCFEVFGYDFLIDADLKPWLLEVNTNPCLELASSHLARIIPNMIENTLRIVIDPLFQEPACHLKHLRNNLELVENKFDLVFHSQCNERQEVCELAVHVPCDEAYCEDESVFSESSTDD